ncbi:MAG: hypothetical protein R2681_10050 [Pyrinomonadaceae bacterium]
MLKILLIFSLVSIGIFLNMNSCGGEAGTESGPGNAAQRINAGPQPTGRIDAADEPPGAEPITIADLNRRKPEKGTFRTKGYVAKVFVCPACPPNAQCKPCMKNNIVISEEKSTLENYDIGETGLIIFTKEAKKYAAGEEYEFMIRITEYKTTASELNDIELINSKPLN